MTICSNVLQDSIPKQLKDFTLQSFSMGPSEKRLEKLGYFLVNTVNVVKKLCRQFSKTDGIT